MQSITLQLIETPLELSCPHWDQPIHRVFKNNLDRNPSLFDPCHPAQARELLKIGRAAVFRRYAFTFEQNSLQNSTLLTAESQYNSFN